MAEPYVSVVIPLWGDSVSGELCIRSVLEQDFASKEILLVTPSSRDVAAMAGEAADEVRIVTTAGAGSYNELVRRGLSAAKGDFRAVIMPQCRMQGKGWLKEAVAAFEDRDVALVIPQCRSKASGGLAQKVCRSVLSGCGATVHGEHATVRVADPACAVYRASALVDLGVLDPEGLTPTAEGARVSLKAVESEHTLVQIESAGVVCSGLAEAGGLLSEAVEAGYSDYVLERSHAARWLNAGLLAPLPFALLLIPLALVSLPWAVLLSVAVFVWGWFVSFGLPLRGWDSHVGVLNFVVYAAFALSVRNDWAPALFGKSIHPALLRQWLWLAAILTSYMLLLLAVSVRTAVDARRRIGCSLPGAIAVGAAATAWWIAAGVGYLKGIWSGKPDVQKAA